MCSESKSPAMSGLYHLHADRLQAALPERATLIHDIYHGLTECLNPHLPVLAALVAMAESALRQDYGVLEAYRLVRLPLSVIGLDRVRYRTPIIEDLHETVLSFRMSDLAVEHLRRALRPHGLCVLFLCSCGVVMGKCGDVQRYYGSEDHRRMDRLRSAIDAEGNPVAEVRSLADICVPTMDLHQNGAERRLFLLVEELIATAAHGRAEYSWIDGELKTFIDRAVCSSELAA